MVDESTALLQRIAAGSEQALGEFYQTFHRRGRSCRTFTASKLMSPISCFRSADNIRVTLEFVRIVSFNHTAYFTLSRAFFVSSISKTGQVRIMTNNCRSH